MLVWQRIARASVVAVLVTRRGQWCRSIRLWRWELFLENAHAAHVDGFRFRGLSALGPALVACVEGGEAANRVWSGTLPPHAAVEMMNAISSLVYAQ